MRAEYWQIVDLQQVLLHGNANQEGFGFVDLLGLVSEEDIICLSISGNSESIFQGGNFSS